ncbi:MAG TPA: DUF1501 domain-containing protein [Pirellulales bacterium]|nr:DUF1501 domain-containing protein [Pirellulales bacterium]
MNRNHDRSHGMSPAPPSALPSRREALSRIACGFGGVALRSLLADETRADNPSAIRDPQSAISARPPHFPARAKRVIFLFMHGGVSHVDTFDPKPKLAEMNGQPLPFAKPKFEFAPTGNLLRSPWQFHKCGQSGTEISELFPQLGRSADEMCVIRSMNGGNQVSHGPALLTLHTGDGVFNRPSMGAWVLYGLGSENQDLPGFISFSPSVYHGGSQNYGSAFLPASFQGTRIGDGNTAFAGGGISNTTPADDLVSQRAQLDLLRKTNLRHLGRRGRDARLEARIEAFEMTFRMQMEAPKVMELAGESRSTMALYGVGEEPTDEFGRQCLLARRFAERGVRFVEVNFAYPRNYWDAHGDLKNNHSTNAKRVDKPIAGLLTDLKLRGLLDDTLVVFGTEFGRTPASQGSDGRDHHPHAFSMWLAGGGVKGGMTYGATDEFGYYVVENKVTMPDFHATILHLLGLDHTRLTYRHAGRDFRLTDVHGEVVRAII